MKNNYIVEGDIVRIELKRLGGKPSLWAVVDLTDLPMLQDYDTTWCAATNRTDGRKALFYVQGHIPGAGAKPPNRVRLHNFLMGAKFIDHKDGDTLNNRRINLREVSRSLNAINRGMPSTNTSGIRGVTRHSLCNMYVAQAKLGGKAKYLGLYKTKEEASAVVKKFWEDRGFAAEYARAA